jgi:hypothetical protein
LKQRLALTIALLIVGLTWAGPLLAQPMQPAYPGYPGAFGGLPPYEIVAIVRSKGLEPLSRPMRQGPTYALRAVDPAGREMHVLVDARMGRILRVVPAMRQGTAMSPPYPIPPPGRIVPDGNSPNSRVAAYPNGPDEVLPDERSPAQPGALGSSTIAPARATAKAGPPPLPRPRPKTASSASVAEPASSVAAPANPVPPLVEMDE